MAVWSDVDANVDSGGRHSATSLAISTGYNGGTHFAAMPGDALVGVGDVNAGVDSGGPHPAVPALDSDILVAQFDIGNSDGSHLTAISSSSSPLSSSLS